MKAPQYFSGIFSKGNVKSIKVLFGPRLYCLISFNIFSDVHLIRICGFLLMHPVVQCILFTGALTSLPNSSIK